LSVCFFVTALRAARTKCSSAARANESGALRLFDIDYFGARTNGSALRIVRQLSARGASIETPADGGPSG
jgi:hypothetical protein